MGKTVLLLMTAIVVSGTILSLGQAEMRNATDTEHRITAAESFARETTDAGAGTVLAAAMRDVSFSPIAPFELCSTNVFAGGSFALTHYETRDMNREVEFVIEGSFPYGYDDDGKQLNEMLIVRNKYRWTEPDFPGPFILDAPIANIDIDGGIIDGRSTLDNSQVDRPAYFNPRRFDRYGVDSFADWDDVWDNLEDLNETSGNGSAGAPLHVPSEDPNIARGGSPYQSMGEVYAEHGNGLTTPANIRSAAASLAGTAGSIELEDLPLFTRAGTAWVTDSSYYSFYENDLAAALAALGTLNGYTPTGSVGFQVGMNMPGAPSIVFSDKPIRVGKDVTLKGSGLLLIKGGLELEENATLQWQGIVQIFSSADTLQVNVAEGTLDIDGSLVIDHDKAPPGGHMDLTIFRDQNLDGNWDNGTLGWTPQNHAYYTHTHRYGQEGGGFHHIGGTGWRNFSSECGSGVICPDNSIPTGPDVDPSSARRVTFREAGKTINATTAQSGDHEKHTRFHRLLRDLIAAGDDPIYLTFNNDEARQEYDGLLSVSMNIDGESCTGTAAGFNGCTTGGNRKRTKAFRPSDLRELVVDVGSLRMLQRLINGNPVSEYDSNNQFAGACPSSAAELSALMDWPANVGWWKAKLSMDGEQCVSNNWPGMVGAFDSGLDAIRLEVHKQSNGGLLYEAAMYWHTKEAGHSERTAEEVADQNFFDAISNGESYGVNFVAGDALDLQFNMANIVPLLRTLGLDAGDMTRMATTLERDRDVAYPDPALRCPAIVP